MAWVLATWPEARIRDGGESDRAWQNGANQLTESRNPIIGATLAGRLRGDGSFPRRN